VVQSGGKDGLFESPLPPRSYPKVYNIEMDPHEDLDVALYFPWVWLPALEEVKKYLESVKKYPNPPAPNITQLRSGGG